MNTALIMAGVPVLLGAALGMLPVAILKRVLGALRTFAVVAALVVVLGALLPHSLEELGLPALGLVAAGVALPAVVGRLFTPKGQKHAHGAQVTLGFLALAGHQLLEGAQIAAAAQLGESGWGVLLALSAHTAPLIAAVVLGYAAHDGRVSALSRAAILLVVSLVGAGAGGWLLEALGGLEVYVGALLAGMLINLLSHDLLADLPTTPGERWLDLGATIAGLALPAVLLAGVGHGHGHEPELAHVPQWKSTLQVLLTLAPWALLGATLSVIGAPLMAGTGRGFSRGDLWGRARVGPVGARFWQRSGGLALSPVLVFVGLGLWGWELTMLAAGALLVQGLLLSALLGGAGGALEEDPGPLWFTPPLVGAALLAGLLHASEVTGTLGGLGAAALLPIAAQGMALAPVSVALGPETLRPAFAVAFLVAGPLLLRPGFWSQAVRERGWLRAVGAFALGLVMVVAAFFASESLGLGYDPAGVHVPIWMRVGALGSMLAWVALQLWDTGTRRWVAEWMP